MFGKNPIYPYLKYLPIWSKAHLLSLLGWTWAFLSLEPNTTGNFSQVRLSKHLQAAWRNAGHKTKDLRSPEAKTFSCLLKLRSSHKVAWEQLNRALLAELCHSCFFLSPQASTSPWLQPHGQQGQILHLKSFFLPKVASTPFLPPPPWLELTLQCRPQDQPKHSKAEVCNAQQASGVFGDSDSNKSLCQQHPCALGGSLTEALSCSFN